MVEYKVKLKNTTVFFFHNYFQIGKKLPRSFFIRTKEIKNVSQVNIH